MIKSGIFFTNFYSSASLCSPTRASLMTGRYPFNKDVAVSNVFPSDNYDESFGLPEYLGKKKKISYITSFFSDNGWATGHFGKWHLGFKRGPAPKYYGIQDSKCYLCESDSNSGYDNKDLYFPADASRDIFSDAGNWIEKQISMDMKFYVTVAVQNSHSPLNLRPNQPEELGFSSNLNPYIVSGETRLTEKERSHQIYSTLLKEHDKQLGLFLNKLESLNILNDTLIIWSSDNGPEYQDIYFGSVGNPGPHRGGKRSLYEGGDTCTINNEMGK